MLLSYSFSHVSLPFSKAPHLEKLLVSDMYSLCMCFNIPRYITIASTTTVYIYLYFLQMYDILRKGNQVSISKLSTDKIAIRLRKRTEKILANEWQTDIN